MRRKRNQTIFTESALKEAYKTYCVTGKPVYTKKEARTAINYCRKRGAGYLREYDCKFCNGWHITHELEWQDLA